MSHDSQHIIHDFILTIPSVLVRKCVISLNPEKGLGKIPTMDDTPYTSVDTQNLDSTISELATFKHTWASTPLTKKKTILEKIKKNFLSISDEWVTISLKNKKVEQTNPSTSDEWISGPFPVIRYIRLLHQSINEIEKEGRPHIPGPIKTLHNGQLAVTVFPQNFYERLFYGITYEVWMKPGETIDTLKAKQAEAYKRTHNPKLTLILGSGNFSAQSVMDILYFIYVKNTVAIYKTNPVNRYLRPLIETASSPLIDEGCLRIVDGGALEGAYLSSHPLVESIHLTGASSTYHAVKETVAQTGQEKEISAELGNVGPFIVVPGSWSDKDVKYHAEHLVSTFINNAGFNCSTPRVIIMDSNWNKRIMFIDMVRSMLSEAPLRNAFYPGAEERYSKFLMDHPEAETVGDPDKDELPWTLITDVPSDLDNDICFTVEPFCSILSETALSSEGSVDFLEQAVRFANDKLNGSLVATIVIHPKTLNVPGVSEVFNEAIEKLRYGSIGVNYWGGGSYLTGVTPWGAYQEPDGGVSKSGVGVVNNSLMFEAPEKTVLWAPFRVVPKPVWFFSKRMNTTETFRKLTDFEYEPSVWKVPGILWSAMIPK